MSDMFSDLKNRYERNWVRIDQLQQYVKLGAITEEEYEEISGEEYTETNTHSVQDTK